MHDLRRKRRQRDRHGDAGLATPTNPRSRHVVGVRSLLVVVVANQGEIEGRECDIITAPPNGDAGSPAGGIAAEPDAEARRVVEERLHAPFAAGHAGPGRVGEITPEERETVARAAPEILQTESKGRVEPPDLLVDRRCDPRSPGAGKPVGDELQPRIPTDLDVVGDAEAIPDRRGIEEDLLFDRARLADRDGRHENGRAEGKRSAEIAWGDHAPMVPDASENTGVKPSIAALPPKENVRERCRAVSTNA